MLTRPCMLLLVCLWCSCTALIPSGLALAEPVTEPTLAVPSVKFGGTFRRILPDTPSTLDPALVTDIYGRTVINQVFEGLVQFDAHLNVIPAIAEFWKVSQDGRIWTFMLRRGVKFHHGREVTAEDFVYSFTRLLWLKSAGPITNLFEDISGAKDFLEGRAQSVRGLMALDRYTLQLSLEVPSVSILTALGLTTAAVVPQDYVERLGAEFGRAPVGAGPFKLAWWKPDQEIVLEAHEHYYEGRPFLDSVIFKIVAGSKLEETFAEFLKGNLEQAIVPGGKTEEVATHPQYRKYQRIRKPTLSFLYIGFNTQMKPFDDRLVRQAFTYAIDKEAIVREVMKRGAIPASGPLPPGMPGYDPSLRGFEYDPQKARQLLAKAGYPGGAHFPPVQLWSVHQADTTKAELAAYQRYLGDLGVRVDIHYAPDWPTYKSLLEQGKLPMFRLVRLAHLPDADNFLSPMLHSASPTNYTFYRNPRVDQLLERCRREVDEGLRLAMYREVERTVVGEAPWIAQNYQVFDYLYQPYVQGVEISLLGSRAIPLKKVWFAKTHPEGVIGAIPHDQPSR